MEKRTDYLGSLAKGLAVLEALGSRGPRLTVSEAANHTGLDRSSARRCLLTLRELGYCRYDGKHFMLTRKVLGLSSQIENSSQLASQAQPLLDDLSRHIGESVSIAILDQTEIVYVARAAPRRIMSIGLEPGSRLPAYCTSLGRVLLANAEDQLARKILKNSDRKALTKFTKTRMGDIVEALKLCREDGFALVSGEVELGLRSLAVPLIDAQGNCIAALNTGVSAHEFEPGTMIETLLPALKDCAETLRDLI